MGLQNLKKKETKTRNIDWILDQTIADHILNLIHYCGQNQVLLSIGKTRIGDLSLTFTGSDIEKVTEFFQDKETLLIRIKELIAD